MILKALSEAIGVSGKEDDVRKIILEAINGHADDIRIDPMGSITAIKKGTGENLPRVMIAAHMDEVGFMVTGYDSSGFIRFTSVGGIDSRILPGLRVKVGEKQIPGVIIWTPIHKNSSPTVKRINELRIDIGVSSKDAASGKVKRGERIAFDSQYMETSMTIRGKALDDRAGCAVLIDILQSGPYPVDVLAAFTVQEEIGLRGAKVAAQHFNPDIGIVLETIAAHDLPNPTADRDDRDENNPGGKLGEGPAISAMDRSMITDPRLFKFLKSTAEAENIPYQIKSRLGGGTDGGQIHLSNAGVPSAVISVPCRYLHSPTAFMHKEDFANMGKLVKAALNAMSFSVLEREF